MFHNNFIWGQKIECNLLATQIAALANIGSNYLNAGVVGKPWGTAHESIVPYQAFKTQDGRFYVVGAGDDNAFKKVHLNFTQKFNNCFSFAKLCN